jgi:hypothetical protein
MNLARFRGRLTNSLQGVFGAGILITSIAATWLVPYFGWRSPIFMGARQPC